MAFLTVASVDYKVADFRRLPDERGGGGLRRTVNGHLRADVTWTARQWEAEVVCTTDLEASGVYSAADIQTDVLLSGTGTGAVTVRAEVVADEYRILGDSGDYWRVLTLRLREQIA